MGNGGGGHIVAPPPPLSETTTPPTLAMVVLPAAQPTWTPERPTELWRRIDDLVEENQRLRRTLDVRNDTAVCRDNPLLHHKRTVVDPEYGHVEHAGYVDELRLLHDVSSSHHASQSQRPPRQSRGDADNVGQQPLLESTTKTTAYPKTLDTTTTATTTSPTPDSDDDNDDKHDSKDDEKECYATFMELSRYSAENN